MALNGGVLDQLQGYSEFISFLNYSSFSKVLSRTSLEIEWWVGHWASNLTLFSRVNVFVSDS